MKSIHKQTVQFACVSPSCVENQREAISATSTGPVTAYLEGDDGLGHVAVWHAMSDAIGMAKEHGFGIVGVRKSSHCGALSFYAYQAIEADLIGMAITQTDSGVVPFGGTMPFFGTNPLCVGIPSRRGTPIVLDMATSTVSGGHIYKARAENRPITSTWALDKEGKPTTDPHQAAYWTPAGGAKGFGLGVIVDVLTGLLMGGTSGPLSPSCTGTMRRGETSAISWVPWITIASQVIQPFLSR